MVLTEEAKKARNEYARQWKQANKERVREYHRQWRENNPDKVMANQERYWEKKAAEAVSDAK